MLTVILTALVVLIQLADFYLCYLSFREELTVTERRSLWLKFALCGVVFGIIFGWAFARFGISAPLYKFILMTGWLPWLAIQILSVRRELTQHFFVFSMMKIWCVMQHNWAAIIAVLVGLDAPQFIIVHAVTYLLLFVLCLRIERRFFAKMLPPKKFFDDYGKIVAVLPLVMIFGVLILWAQEPLIHTWQERFSRFYLPFVFFFIYRHIMLTTEQLQEQRRTEQNLRRTKDQLAALGEYNRLMQESRDAVAVMRHDLRHSYRLLYMMLLSGKVDAAKDYLEAQEKSLGKTVVKSFCKPPLLNAALSVYLSRAESLAVKVRHKINLPQIAADLENDLALLVSNLLENALKASVNQPPTRRKISIVIQQVGEQFVLEVANLCDTPVDFDEKNYPRTSLEGHGLGMASVKNFADKYKAYIDFSQESGVFKVTIYWLS